ncbi:hypothetical protein OIV83_000640 [Microbotryomycetes sp. JL201]|nr:hypothetical protein OIV83_000640 [Microbotryomycetes sp. JL201]
MPSGGSIRTLASGRVPYSTSTPRQSAFLSPIASSSSLSPHPKTPMPRDSTAASKSLFAGIIAGGIEGFITYPAEYAKTVAQFQSKPGQKASRRKPIWIRVGPVKILTETLKTQGVRGIYSGCGALVAGNAAKAGVRFLTYDQIKSYLVDDTASSAFLTLLAGLGAGVCEAVLAVTPSETIKTKLIDDAKRAVPQYNGLAHGTVTICRTEGFAGIYRGLFPTIMKQGANSAVRFTSYSTIKQWLQDRSGVTKQLSAAETFAAGAGAGVITVYATMPFDTVKTRMQSLNAAKEYRNSLHCVLRVVREEGALSLWGGATPRLARLSMSGGIVFFVYEKMMALMK